MGWLSLKFNSTHRRCMDRVRIADGSRRVINDANPASWRTGERLVVIGGGEAVEPMNSALLGAGTVTRRVLVHELAAKPFCGRERRGTVHRVAVLRLAVGHLGPATWRAAGGHRQGSLRSGRIAEACRRTARALGRSVTLVANRNAHPRLRRAPCLMPSRAPAISLAPKRPRARSSRKSKDRYCNRAPLGYPLDRRSWVTPADPGTPVFAHHTRDIKR